MIYKSPYHQNTSYLQATTRKAMGQYWTMKNLDKCEELSAHIFGCGLKYLEQWRSSTVSTANMVLLTDVSSLGYGGGDFRLSDVPEELKKFVQPILGRWAGDRIVFSGDYTENKESDADGNKTFTDISDENETFTDISIETALAVWTMYACESRTDTGDAKTVKARLLCFLKKYKSGGIDSKAPMADSSSVALKPLLMAIEKMNPEQTDSLATNRLSAPGSPTSFSAAKTRTASKAANPAPPEKKRKIAHM